jgi:hypothetical protein
VGLGRGWTGDAGNFGGQQTSAGTGERQRGGGQRKPLLDESSATEAFRLHRTGHMPFCLLA